MRRSAHDRADCAGRSTAEGFADFAAFAEHLDGLGMFHMRLGMNRMRTATRRLGLITPRPALVQVVGTNGKGSTALFLSRIAEMHGLRTGLFTSPHFLSFLERIRINGRQAEPDEVLDWANAVQAHVRDLDPTYFELLALIAMHGFQDRGLDLAVLEAGLGGKNDATSAWTPNVVLVTPIGLDHAHVIGPDLEHIARDKAGAIKPGGLVITGAQEPLVVEVLRQEADRKKARLADVDAVLAEFPGQCLATGPAGAHQIDNARLALAGWLELCRVLSHPWNEDTCRAALASAFWPGRLQRVAGPPEIILDGAHNPPALASLARSLDGLGIRPATLVFACMQDKDLRNMIPVLRRLTSGPIFVPELPRYERARPAAEIAAILGKTARPVEQVAEALDMAGRIAGPVLVCGSLYLLAEVYKIHPQWLTPEPAGLTEYRQCAW